LTFKEFPPDRKPKRRSLTAADFEYFFKVQINWPAVCMAKSTDFLSLQITSRCLRLPPW